MDGVGKVHRLFAKMAEISPRCACYLIPNLPCAMPIEPEPKTYEDFLVIVAKEFRIANLQRLEKPPWQEGELL